MDTWREVDQVTKMTNKVKIMGFGQKELTLCWFGRERERGREKKKFKLLSSIFGVPLVRIRRVKNESSSTQRGLCMGTENTRFRRGFKRGVREVKGFGFRKCPQDFLEFLLSSKR